MQLLAHPVYDSHRFLRVSIRKGDQKLVTAHTGNQIRFANILPQNLSECRKHLVSDGMTVSIVHLFETVQIADTYAEGAAVDGRITHVPGKNPVEFAPVQESG